MNVLASIFVFVDRSNILHLLAKHLLLIACMLISVGCTVSKNQSTPLNLVDSIVVNTLESIKARGGSIAIRIDNSEIYSASYGSGFSIEHPAALGSTSKPVTAYILMQMEIDGLVDINAPIGLYVPELMQVRNGVQISDKTLFEFMTHNAGIAAVQFGLASSWQQNLSAALAAGPAQGHVYANENYALLTQVVVNILGSYEEAIRKYINVGGISTFRSSSKFVDPSYVGAGGLEASASDYLRFMEKSAPMSVLQAGGFGISWFHGESGYIFHQGMIVGGGRDQYALALWGATAESGSTISLVFQANAFDTDALLIQQLLGGL